MVCRRDVATSWLRSEFGLIQRRKALVNIQFCQLIRHKHRTYDWVAPEHVHREGRVAGQPGAASLWLSDFSKHRSSCPRARAASDSRDQPGHHTKSQTATGWTERLRREGTCKSHGLCGMRLSAPIAAETRSTCHAAKDIPRDNRCTCSPLIVGRRGGGGEDHRAARRAISEESCKNSSWATVDSGKSRKDPKPDRNNVDRNWRALVDSNHRPTA